MRCPNCGNALEVLDSDCNLEKVSKQKITAYFYGHCGECGKAFTWDRVFIFDEDSEPEEVIN